MCVKHAFHRDINIMQNLPEVPGSDCAACLAKAEDAVQCLVQMLLVSIPVPRHILTHLECSAASSSHAASHLPRCCTGNSTDHSATSCPIMSRP